MLVESVCVGRILELHDHHVSDYLQASHLIKELSQCELCAIGGNKGQN